MSNAGGTPANVNLGPGRLYYAALGTAEPTSASAAMPSAWKVIGYTEDGSEVQTAITSEAINVAEEFDPIAFLQTLRRTTLTVTMAETMVNRLALALGAGAGVAADGTAFEFPDPSAIVAVMFVWDSDEIPGANNRRWIFRSCTPSGTVSLARRKAPAKSLIPVTFDCSRTSTLGPIKVYPNAAGEI